MKRLLFFGSLFLLGGLSLPVALSATQTSPNQSSSTEASDKPAGSQTTKFDILDSAQPLVIPISKKDGNGQGEGTLIVLNSQGTPINSFTSSFALQDESGRRHDAGTIHVQVSPSGPLAEYEPEAFTVSVSLDHPLPPFESTFFSKFFKGGLASQNLSGYLFLHAGNLTARRPLQLISAEQSPLANFPVYLSLGIAVTIGLVCIWVLRDKLGKQMGLPAWSSSSLATNLGFITSLAAATANLLVPVKPHLLQKSEYTTLSMLFAALITVAPLAYSSIRLQPQSDGSAATPNYKGYVVLLILTNIITLWGAFGALTVVAFYFIELAEAHLLSPFASWVFLISLVLIGLLLILYAISSTLVTVRASTSDGGEPVRVSGETTSQPLRWPLL
ncbi:MAG: hypothetical protein ACJ74J_12860 [Blastocatellia bacterium]